MANTFDDQYLSCFQGRNFAVRYQLLEESSPFDLTGYDARMKVRDSSNTVIADWSTAEQITPADGIIDIDIQAADTVDIPAGTYVYEVIIDDGGGNQFEVKRGVFEVLPLITD